MDGRLPAVSATGKAALARAIHIAVETGLGTGVHPGQALAIERPSGASPHQVLVTPMHGLPARFDLGARRICAAIFVADPQTTPRASLDAVRERFGLTPAEAKVLAALVDGSSVREAAARLGVSERTVSTHLGRVFMKTGTHRQSELIRRVLAAPPIDPAA